LLLCDLFVKTFDYLDPCRQQIVALRMNLNNHTGIDGHMLMIIFHVERMIFITELKYFECNLYKLKL
jgi:hypothetical protein